MSTGFRPKILRKMHPPGVESALLDAARALVATEISNADMATYVVHVGYSEGFFIDVNEHIITEEEVTPRGVASISKVGIKTVARITLALEILESQDG